MHLRAERAAKKIDQERERTGNLRISSNASTSIAEDEYSHGIAGRVLGLTMNQELDTHIRALVQDKMVDEIPDILRLGYDPFMVLSSIKNENTLHQIRQAMKESRKPPNERLKRYNTIYPIYRINPI